MQFAFNFGIFMKEKGFPSSSYSEIIADDPQSCGKKKFSCLVSDQRFMMMILMEVFFFMPQQV